MIQRTTADDQRTLQEVSSSGLTALAITKRQDCSKTKRSGNLICRKHCPRHTMTITGIIRSSSSLMTGKNVDLARSFAWCENVSCALMHLLTETEIRTKSIPRTKQMKIEIFRMKYNKDKKYAFPDPSTYLDQSSKSPTQMWSSVCCIS